jgi:hypothetical protein
MFSNKEFAQEAIQRQKSSETEHGDHTIIGNIMKTIDPQTGKKCTDLDLLANGNVLMYPSG